MTGKTAFHLPSLDGIRAVAALLVFVSHAGLGHIIPGGLGVTIFFFLSGYLITTLLRREYEKYGSISLSDFYLRRICRILPPLYIALLLIVVASRLGLVAWDPGPMDVLAQVFQIVNYYVITSPGTNLPPFAGVFWSLAVEEHFYLIFPLFFALCMRRWHYPMIAKAFFAVCCGVLIWRIFLVHGLHVPESRTYLATDTRLDSLLYGCILGVWGNPALDLPPRLPVPAD
jgi:peptidoglycan/LPS O-acetylase OafA/YrhL